METRTVKFVSVPPELGLDVIVMDVCSGSGISTSGAVDDFLQQKSSTMRKRRKNRPDIDKGFFLAIISDSIYLNNQIWCHYSKAR